MQVRTLKPSIRTCLLSIRRFVARFLMTNFRGMSMNLLTSLLSQSSMWISLECLFHNQSIKHTLKDFDTHFELLSKGNEVCISSAPSFVKFDLVKSISKSVIGDRLDMTNFHIRQVKFEIRILHWIVVKVLYKKP